jgi:UDP:flavonoid glycosyltransferase YjiC (YdhE family)
MSRWVDAWLEGGGAEAARCFVQTGTSAVPRLAEHRDYLGYEEMEAMVREASVVVCHGGPGTIMLASNLGKRPIVVPREKGLGEHVDNHQCAFAERIARDGAILLARSEDDLRAHLDGCLGLAGAAADLPGPGAAPGPAVELFEQLIDELLDRSRTARRRAVGSDPATRRSA